MKIFFRAIITLIGIIFLNQNTFAQANFKEARILRLEGDTLKGLIDLKEWTRNPKEILFKEDLKSSIVKFSAFDLNFFEVLNLDSYQSFDVSVSMNNTVLSNTASAIDTTNENRRVFLKLLFKGKLVNLYSYRDELKTRYYLLDNKEVLSPFELKFIRYFSASKRLVEINYYRNQLKEIAIKYLTISDNLRKKIDLASYIDEDLIKIVAEINQQDIPVIDIEKVKSKTKVYFFVGLNLNLSTVNFSKSNFFYGGKNEPSYLPGGSIGIDITNNNNVGKLIYRFELGYANANLKYQKIEEIPGIGFERRQYRIRQKTISFNPSFIYNLYNSNKLKLFVGSGLTLNYSFFENDRYIFSQKIGDFPEQVLSTTPLGEQHIGLSLPIKTGLNINKKIQLNLTYNTPYPINSNDNANSGRNQTVGLGLNYIFIKN